MLYAENVKRDSCLYLVKRTMTLRRISPGLKSPRNQNFIKGQMEPQNQN